jgi:DNA mismatch repair protein MutL
MQSFFVNSRYIRSPLLSDSLQTAYQTLLPRNRFPAAVIFVEIDTNEVDVNVHPAKREVRFSRERDVYRQLLAAVRQALHSSSIVAELSPQYNSGMEKQQINPGTFSPNLFSRDTVSHHDDPSVTDYRPFAAVSRQDGENSVSFPELQPVGRYREGYILAQSESKDLYIVDQHAAHERLLYELYKDDVEKGNMPVQQIIPMTVELDSLSASSLRSRLKLFAQLGLNFEVFGNNTFILRTVPLFYREFLKQEDILELVAAPEKSRTVRHYSKKLLK